jgi:G protein-coupled receptor family C group 6 protein A
MAATLRFLSKFNCSRETVAFQCDYSSYVPKVKAVIGAGYSEITMAVSRMLNLQLMPQVGFLHFHTLVFITFIITKDSGKPRESS